MKLKLLSLFVALTCATSLFASDIQVDGIWYNFYSSTKTAEVTYRGSSYSSYEDEYSGSVVIPKTVTYNSTTYSVTTIGEGAFYHCFGLTSVTIPNSVTTIGDWAFDYCTGLTSVTIPNSVTTIGERAFSNCYCLASVTIPNSVTTIGNSVFANCYGLTSVTIPNSVTTIEYYAFAYCDGLTSITIPNSVTEIGTNAFCNVNNIVYNGIATWESNDKYWGAKCVNGYVEGYLVYSDATKTTLCGCSSAAKGEIIIPNSVTTIGEYAFAYCSGLSGSLTIPNSVTEIGSSAFSGCRGLTSVTIPNSVTTIGDNAFSVCYGLTSITIPNSVTTIGDRAFYNCSGLISVTIPNSVTTIGRYAFCDCTGLTSIDVDATNTHYCSMDGVLFNYAKDTLIQYPIGNSRTEYTIPNSVTEIGSSAFSGCSGLTSVTIPNSVKTIGSEAFDNCTSLTSVTIPNSVTTIEYYAFAYCDGLTSVTCYAVTPPECGNNVFEEINQDAKVYVPASALTDYQNAEVWKDLLLLPITAEVTPMDDENPIVTPTDQDVTITWPITDGTDTYTLTITKNGETVCVLTFNGNGQLTNIAFAAPGHNGAHQAPAATLTAQGYQFTVTGLNPGTAYDYSVTATDASGKTLAEHKGNFSTTGGTGFESVHGSQPAMHKVLRNGQILLERNNATYTLMGQKVR